MVYPHAVIFTGFSSVWVPPDLPNTYVVYTQMFYFPNHTQGKQQ